MTISRYEEMYGKLDSLNSVKFQEDLRCYCSECNISDCKHRNCFRRLPLSVGGLGLCKRFSDDYKIFRFESHSCSGNHIIHNYLIGKNFVDAFDNARISMTNMQYNNIDKVEVLV